MKIIIYNFKIHLKKKIQFNAKILFLDCLNNYDKDSKRQLAYVHIFYQYLLICTFFIAKVRYVFRCLKVLNDHSAIAVENPIIHNDLVSSGSNIVFIVF